LGLTGIGTPTLLLAWRMRPASSSTHDLSKRIILDPVPRAVA
jgi:hypothetical protein